MEISVRKPYQGVWNIIRFNWQYYALSVLIVLFIIILQQYFKPLNIAGIPIVMIIVSSTIISLVVSFYIYDFSDLYKLSWLSDIDFNRTGKIININAGFDETSSVLKKKFENCELFVADFYDSSKHTELSIKRARKAYSSYPGTQQVLTTHLPIYNSTADIVFIFFSAHEIRDDEERIAFFKELHRILKPAGKIIVTEHLRDKANFLAYNIGFFHFYSKVSWLNTFRFAGLKLSNEIKITPFITTFILEKNGSAS
jgi:SAM-dependent methyltransferase